MDIQSIVSLKDLALKKSLTLPASILDKKIELFYPEAIKNDEFTLHYNEDEEILTLHYMQYDPFADDYWEFTDVGEFITKVTDELIESLTEQNKPFFQIATYEHGTVYHYPIASSADVCTCRWDTRFGGVFVPSEWFIQDCENNQATMLERLKSIFSAYSDWCNGEVYVLKSDTYHFKHSNQDVIFIDDSDCTSNYIGYSSTLNELQQLI
ncbi:hypothetical protein [Zophobihabitans entericus]|uniref:Uncharacterized protein n=1 Tax=Zophobihabitans entericus TaxID=1635327 RepID=A0A6G9ID29_9GAMM|nr:hypothetical protein [Zophobihabitans entericus]QIQ22141.1 hypothetical protein IPMB12_10870 [Zophobihabitans entericus]